MTDDKVLRAAVRAQSDYEKAVQEAKVARRREFQKAVDSGVSARSIARSLGKSPSWVTRILKNTL